MYIAAGIEGNFTNLSLRSTSVTRLFEAKVDEQLIMQRIGHSFNVVRAYKQVGEKLCTVTLDVLCTVTLDMLCTETLDVLSGTVLLQPLRIEV